MLFNEHNFIIWDMFPIWHKSGRLQLLDSQLYVQPASVRSSFDATRCAGGEKMLQLGVG
jgi:hypothetical protein